MSACSALSEVAAPIRPRLELAEIFRSHGEHYRTEYSVAPEQAKAMRDIQACRTAALGGHLDVCDEGCGYQRISYNSCRNRHCPKCQGLQSARWLEKRFDKVLPTPYFHMVFTIPHELVGITLQNRKTLYNILFRAAAQSLLQLAQEWERLRAHIGFTAILHTWSQELPVPSPPPYCGHGRRPGSVKNPMDPGSKQLSRPRARTFQKIPRKIHRPPQAGIRHQGAQIPIEQPTSSRSRCL